MRPRRGQAVAASERDAVPTADLPSNHATRQACFQVSLLFSASCMVSVTLPESRYKSRVANRLPQPPSSLRQGCPGLADGTVSPV